MSDNLSHSDLPEVMTRGAALAAAVELVRDAVSLLAGFEVEVETLEPLDCGEKTNVRVYWRRKGPEGHPVYSGVG